MKGAKTKLPWILGVIVLAAALLYGFWPEPVEVDLGQVTRGSLTVTVNDDGETRIREKYVVSAPVGGRLLRVQLHAGDPVKRGITELVYIEPGSPPLLDARTQAECEARLHASEAALQQAEAALQRDKEALELAEHEYQRAQELIPTNAISRSQFDTAEHRQRIAHANVLSAEFAVKVAAFELEHARAAAARYDAESLSKPTPFRLISPVDGRVLRVFHEDAGVVSPQTHLLEMGDPQDLELVIDVLSSDAVRIQPGNEVFIDHWGGKEPLAAVVRTVEPSAFLKVSALGVEEKRVNVIADFVDPWSRRSTLGDGFRVEARIVVASTSGEALKVPAGTLFREGDSWKVFRVVGGIAQLRPVEIGKTNGLETEITRGLSEGDIVVLHPTNEVRDHVRVSPAQ